MFILHLAQIYFPFLSSTGSALVGEGRENFITPSGLGIKALEFFFLYDFSVQNCESEMNIITFGSHVFTRL